MLSAIGYLRVSTTEQAEEGHGLAVQEAAIRAYCRDHHLRLVDLLRDEGQSGSNGLQDRLGLGAALAKLERGDADVLVVARLDRLARDVIIQETVIRRLQTAGRDVVSVAEPEGDGNEGTRRLVRVVLGAIAEYERDLIRGRMIAGKQAKVAAGGYGGGRPAYGKRVEGGELVDDADETRVVERIRALRADGHSYRAICEALEADGIKPRRAERWQPATVREIALRTEA
jgi:DNA invertase Pin-like site-specific DNA recombinase